ncbi:TPA: hypothetical protein NQF56_001004 [Klebsiella variicola]|nr:hypothetical protein [Klebsiella variicola]
MKRASSLLLLLLSAVSVGAEATENIKPVIEIVTLKLKPGVSAEKFKKIGKKIEEQHVSRQPGFIYRESAAGPNHDWLVIVHWRSVKDADASMKSFPSASAAQKFMDSIDASSMKMTRYQQP